MGLILMYPAYAKVEIFGTVNKLQIGMNNYLVEVTTGCNRADIFPEYNEEMVPFNRHKVHFPYESETWDYIKSEIMEGDGVLVNAELHYHRPCEVWHPYLVGTKIERKSKVRLRPDELKQAQERQRAQRAAAAAEAQKPEIERER